MAQNCNYLLFILFALIVIYCYNTTKSKLDNINPSCPIVNFKTITGDIGINPIGCYINIYDQYFISCVNPYSTKSVQDNGMWVINYPDDMLTVINRAINNGYTEYGKSLKKKYTDFSQLDILEIATLGYYCGYKFMSITNFDKLNQIFFSYSQPQVSTNGGAAKPDLPFALLPMKNSYTNEIENAPGKRLSCGNICLKDGKPQLDEKGNVYTCGSILSPTIKTPPRYSVYQIYEKT
jgi:hypothetical protein